MNFDLGGLRVEFRGDDNPVAAATRGALVANGAIDSAGADTAPDILLVSFPLLPDAEADVAPLLAATRRIGALMAGGGGGRIVLLVSAIAGMPMRRHPEFSAAMASVLATMRTLAMALGPKVLVNAVGVGAIGKPLVGGDAAMLGHAAVPGPGTIAGIADTVLFFCDPQNSYTTGQMLSVDGGWSAGYARNF